MTYNDFHVDYPAAGLSVERNEIREDTHDDNGRDPDQGVGGQEDGREPGAGAGAAVGHCDCWFLSRGTTLVAGGGWRGVESARFATFAARGENGELVGNGVWEQWNVDGLYTVNASM